MAPFASSWFAQTLFVLFVSVLGASAPWPNAICVPRASRNRQLGLDATATRKFIILGDDRCQPQGLDSGFCYFPIHGANQFSVISKCLDARGYLELSGRSIFNLGNRIHIRPHVLYKRNLLLHFTFSRPLPAQSHSSEPSGKSSVSRTARLPTNRPIKPSEHYVISSISAPDSYQQVIHRSL